MPGKNWAVTKFMHGGHTKCIGLTQWFRPSFHHKYTLNPFYLPNLTSLKTKQCSMSNWVCMPHGWAKTLTLVGGVLGGVSPLSSRALRSIDSDVTRPCRILRNCSSDLFNSLHRLVILCNKIEHFKIEVKVTNIYEHKMLYDNYTLRDYLCANCALFWFILRIHARTLSLSFCDLMKQQHNT